MPYSMTGFAVAEAAPGAFRLVWEVRSVNHRFLDMSFRLPERLRSLEPKCRETVSARIRRGKLDCTLKWTAGEQQDAAPLLNEAGLQKLGSLVGQVRAHFPDARPLTTGEILRWPGIVSEPEEQLGALQEPIIDCLAEAIDNLQLARAREGKRIAAFMDERLDALDALISDLRPRLDGIRERLRGKLQERLARLAVEPEPERLEQELAVVAQRLDVEEEVDRLAGHVTEVRRLLSSDAEPVGRRLDFIVQELHREANTLASKAQDEVLAHKAVDLKVLIEQMREQVQNLE
jgi:uncharacterized protein (TIGR00255 family)